MPREMVSTAIQGTNSHHQSPRCCVSAIHIKIAIVLISLLRCLRGGISDPDCRDEKPCCDTTSRTKLEKLCTSFPFRTTDEAVQALPCLSSSPVLLVPSTSHSPYRGRGWRYGATHHHPHGRLERNKFLVRRTLHNRRFPCRALTAKHGQNTVEVLENNFRAVLLHTILVRPLAGFQRAF